MRIDCCQQAQIGNLSLEIGGKADPDRSVFDAQTGTAVCASIMDMGGRYRLVANVVDVIPTDEPPPKPPAARALRLPRPNLKVAAATWIFAGGAHHTGFSYSVAPEHLHEFAEMAGIEFLLIDENTTVEGFKDTLRWNDLTLSLEQGLVKLSIYSLKSIVLSEDIYSLIPFGNRVYRGR